MKRHFASLDGLRALSILFVIWCHLSYSSQVPRVLRATSLGLDGVLIFFVLSGYLITSNLIREKAHANTIDLGSFIAQRAFRLLPASFALVAVASVAYWLGYIQLSTGDIIHALTYTMDYYHPSTATLQHLWSLSVEEQFYLLWPLILRLTTNRRAGKICFGALLLCPLSRLITWHYYGDSMIAEVQRFDDVADSLAVGCLLALYRDRLPSWTRSNQTLLIALATIVASGLMASKLPVFLVLHVSIASVCAALAINSLTSQNHEISIAFSWRPVAWLGTVSYSLYLWQQFFLLGLLRGQQLVQKFPYNVLASLTCAILSFYLLERPIRAWGRRFKTNVPQLRQFPAISLEVAHPLSTSPPIHSDFGTA